MTPNASPARVGQDDGWFMGLGMVTVAAFSAGGWFASLWGYPLMAALAGSIFLGGALLYVYELGPRARRRRTSTRPEERIANLEAELAITRTQLTAAKRAHREASAGVARAAEAVIGLEENVRGTICADLHDSVAQTITYIGLQALDDNVDREFLWTLLSGAEQELRAVMHTQSPLELKNKSFDELVQRLVTAYRSTPAAPKLKVNWPNGKFALGLPQATALYRFIQEGLQNTMRHSDADNVNLTVVVKMGVIQATIEDDGVGFQPQLLEKTSRLGHRLMRRRVQVLGGDIELTTAPGEGTKLDLNLPSGFLAA